MRSHERPATDTELRKEFPDLSNVQRAEIMQALLNEVVHLYIMHTNSSRY